MTPELFELIAIGGFATFTALVCWRPWVAAALIAGYVAGSAATASATLTLYTNENDYNTAVAALGSRVYSRNVGFEDTYNWSIGTQKPGAAVNWQSASAGNSVLGAAGNARTGTRSFSSSPHGTYSLGSPTCDTPGACGDGVLWTLASPLLKDGAAATKVYGLGGWVKSSTATASVSVTVWDYDDGTLVVGTVPITNTHSFVGFIDDTSDVDSGVRTVEIRETTGTTSTPKSIWLDDVVVSVRAAKTRGPKVVGAGCFNFVEGCDSSGYAGEPSGAVQYDYPYYCRLDVPYGTPDPESVAITTAQAWLDDAGWGGGDAPTWPYSTTCMSTPARNLSLNDVWLLGFDRPVSGALRVGQWVVMTEAVHPGTPPELLPGGIRTFDIGLPADPNDPFSPITWTTHGGPNTTYYTGLQTYIAFKRADGTYVAWDGQIKYTNVLLPAGNHTYIFIRGDTEGKVDIAEVTCADEDLDGLCDSNEDSCETIKNYFYDLDGDGVDQACDTCTSHFNPPISGPPASNRSLISHQPDDDLDGRGNACDFDYDNVGLTVNTTDWNDGLASQGKSLSLNTCGQTVALGGSGNTQKCTEFDHVPGGITMNTSDFAALQAAQGQPISNYPKCTNCQVNTGSPQGWSRPVSDPVFWSSYIATSFFKPICESAITNACVYPSVIPLGN